MTADTLLDTNGIVKPSLTSSQAFSEKIPSLTMLEKLDLIEKLTQSIRSADLPAESIPVSEEQRIQQRREMLEFLDEIEREAEQAGTETIRLTDRDHDRIIYNA